MESAQEKKENLKSSPSALNEVDNLISQKNAEKGAEAIQQSTEGIQGEVADVMSGVETASQTISEKKGESGERRDFGGGGGVRQSDDQQNQTSGGFTQRVMPNEEVMIKKIRTAIQLQIKHEQKKAERLKKHLATGSAQEYSHTIAKIRRLQETLKSLFHHTFETLKGVYFKYFNSDGRRKQIEEI